MSLFRNILILAGGDSTRFWPLEDKNSLFFLGKPLIKHLVDEIKQFGQNIYIVVNQSHITKYQEYLVGVSLIPQTEFKKGQASAILSAKPHVTGETLIINANDVLNPSILKKFASLAKEKKKTILFLAKKTSTYFPGGYLKFKNDTIDEIIEKPQPDKTPSDVVKLVVDYFPDYAILTAALEKVVTTQDNHYETAINSLLKAGYLADYLAYDDYWYTLKFPWETLSLNAFFLHHLVKNSLAKDAMISQKAIIVPPVTIESGVRIGDYSKIVGPCYIGQNTTIGDFVMIRKSHIGRDCLIGGYSEITRSYISDRLMTHRNYIGDSVLSKNVLFGAGAITANLRFDQSSIQSRVNDKPINSNRDKLGTIIGKGAKIGVNATILPGRKIGKNSFIAPGTTVDEDIPDNVFFSNGVKTPNKLTK